ncbi:hypothetical protein F9K33_11140 [bacterium]|nr:MAG: hypothetical protein F9K33_11140 [bacterium]
MKNAFRFIAAMTLPLALMAMFLVISCEGPRGPAGENGTNGTNGINGVDANETCKQCHTPAVVDQLALEFEFSKHFYGEAAFEEAGNTGCSPCHTQEAFLYVVANPTIATGQFVLNTATPPKYALQYSTTSSQALGEIRCGTCHSNLHETYTSADNALTTTAAVPMVMWGATKTINLTQDGGKSNLCVKCHQPRALSYSSSFTNGNRVQYDSLVLAPSTVLYDSAVGNAFPNKIIPSYRTHVHYGVVGAVFAGQGGVEFTGSATYANSAHTSVASCQDCHMATRSGRAGGHTFMVQGNFNGCNVSGCHSAAPISSSSTTKWTTPRANQKAQLDALAAKLNALGGGTPILHSETDSELNLWAGLTTGNWDGYLDIYLANTNDNGYWRNPSTSGMTSAQIAINNAKPKFPSLTARDIGAMINFQFALRESSNGIHNTAYTSALLANTIALFP